MIAAASFDMAIRLGDIMQIITIAAGGLMVLGYMKAEARNNDKRLEWLEGEMMKQTEILARLASGEERMNGLDRRITLVEQRQISASA